MVLQNSGYRHFTKAVIFSMVLALLVAVFVLIYGKENSFLVINKYNSPEFDYFFRYLTYLGDGLIWIPLFVYALIFRRDFFLAVLTGLIICTLLSQGLKRFVFEDSYRPIVLLAEKVRTIPGYYINRAHSFPSGHTSTAFTLALLGAFLVKRNFWTYFFPVIAFFVGYSRVYLAQHFVIDVLAAMYIGIISAWFALFFYQRFQKKKQEHQPETIENKNDLD